MHITALLSKRDTKAPNRCRRGPLGLQALNRCFASASCRHLYKALQNKGPSFDLCSAVASKPWEVSKPSDLIRAARVPRAEWRMDLPITPQKASIKLWLLTWYKEKQGGRWQHWKTNKDRERFCTVAMPHPTGLTRSPANWQIKTKLQRQGCFFSVEDRQKQWPCLA